MCYQTLCHQQMSGQRSTDVNHWIPTVNALKLPYIPKPPSWWQTSRYTLTSYKLTLPYSHGYQYLLTCWRIYPMAWAIFSQRLQLSLRFGWIVHFGVPSTIITGRGRLFVLNQWTQLNCLFSIHRQHTTQLQMVLWNKAPIPHWSVLPIPISGLMHYHLCCSDIEQLSKLT